MLIEDAAATATEGVGKLISVQPTEVIDTNDNSNGSNSTGVSVSVTVGDGGAAAAVTTTPTIIPEHVVIAAAAAGRPLNTLNDEEKCMIGVHREEIVFEALKSQYPPQHSGLVQRRK